MQVKHSLRRIASLSAFVVAIGISSISHAGIIPWVYDAVFGPVHYRSCGYGCGYSPYVVSYQRPVVIRSYAPTPYGYAYAPSSGCSSCSTSYYAPMVYAAPNSGCGSCGPIVMTRSSGSCGSVTYASASHGCLSGCSEKPAEGKTPAQAPGQPTWKAQEPSKAASSTTVTPSSGTATDDGLRVSPRVRGKTTVEADELLKGTDPSSGDEEPTILKRNKVPAKINEPNFEEPMEIIKPKTSTLPIELEPETGGELSVPKRNNKTPAKPDDSAFEAPIENIKPKESKKANELELEFDSDKKAPGEAKSLPPVPTLNLDAKIAWRTESQRTRVPFHAKLAKASVTRSTPGANSDWTPVVAKVTGTQVAKK
jgi:hypothetical protein